MMPLHWSIEVFLYFIISSSNRYCIRLPVPVRPFVHSSVATSPKATPVSVVIIAALMRLGPSAIKVSNSSSWLTFVKSGLISMLIVSSLTSSGFSLFAILSTVSLNIQSILTAANVVPSDVLTMSCSRTCTSISARAESVGSCGVVMPIPYTCS